MGDAVTEALAKAGVKKEEVACLIPHQANQRIIDAVAERLDFPKEKVFVNLQKYGNTSAASCAIGLCEAVAGGRVKKGDKVVLATFGAGLVWGAMVIEW
jgi:3-oxoacyl-[acyl-carrier-protein] synthase-3